MNNENKRECSSDCELDIVDTIKYHIENKMIMTVVRKEISEDEKILGFPLNISKELLLISEVLDFRDDGCLIMRLKDITDAYSMESEAFYEKICIDEGLRNKAVQENPLTDITDLMSVVTQLSNYDKFISIHCELDDGLHFSIGKISSIKEDMIYFDHFNLEGIWQDEKKIIPINKITLISINDNYSNTFYKYLKFPS